MDIYDFYFKWKITLEKKLNWKKIHAKTLDNDNNHK